MLLNEGTMKTMLKMSKAIEKGALEDIRDYLQNCGTVTTNGASGVRADKINTNLSMMVASESIDIKLFRRSWWKGVLVVDRENKMLISVCTRNTLDRVVKDKTRKSPHYAQTMVNTINRNEVATVKQMSLFDVCPEFVTEFSEDDYEKDFLSIMEKTASEYDGYRFWIVSYDVEHYVMKSLNATLMDRNFNKVQEISLLETLKPNFGDLTVIESGQEKKNNVRGLLSVKNGISADKSMETEKRTEILPKAIEESNEA